MRQHPQCDTERSLEPMGSRVLEQAGEGGSVSMCKHGLQWG